jgi:hypothetical protein
MYGASISFPFWQTDLFAGLPLSMAHGEGVGGEANPLQRNTPPPCIGSP